jgi:hypothetical protein
MIFGQNFEEHKLSQLVKSPLGSTLFPDRNIPGNGVLVHLLFDFIRKLATLNMIYCEDK